MSAIVVIGSGISGTLTALELAENHQVILIEAAHEVLPNSCTSRNQCFKLHTGMHYFGDIQTAKALRKAASESTLLRLASLRSWLLIGGLTRFRFTSPRQTRVLYDGLLCKTWL